MYFKSFIYNRIIIIRLFDRPEYDTLKYQIGSIEMVQEKGYNYIENIYIDNRYRNKGYLRKIINYLTSDLSVSSKPLVCLPLPEHVEKFKHLGFTFYKQEGEDIYYILR